MVANHGWAAAMRTAGDHLRRRLRRAPAPPSDTTTWLSTAEHEFDRQYGVDTSGLVWSVDLKTGSPNDAWNTAYYGIGPSVFHHVMAQVPESLQRSATFIDLGCGKGRAVLLASQYPFAHVIGVEIAPQLHRIAMDNVAHYTAVRQADARDVAPMHILLDDAANYRFPGGPLVLYLYHPFCRPVLEKVLRNLGRSLVEERRDAAVIYINHELRDALDRAPYLQQVWSATVAMDATDRLADRVGSSAEDCAVYLTRRQN
ncbi:MAG TPA: class I SAM-dependent methyltransferase [Acidobacteriaceae bacterium]|jgi:SAM-dependent methyltransferase|nr:class I SAM-dependent methyltransferase [Acidobacteriaceae bacterium]